MMLTEDTRLDQLIEEHPGAVDYLTWRGIELEGAWGLDETLGALCEQWEIEWDELEGELDEWLREEEEVRLVEWNERIEGGEE